MVSLTKSKQRQQTELHKNSLLLQHIDVPLQHNDLEPLHNMYTKKYCNTVKTCWYVRAHMFLRKEKMPILYTEIINHFH